MRIRFLWLGLLVLLVSGCNAIPNVKADLQLKGSYFEYTFNGINDEIAQFNNYYPKTGYKYYTVFITIKNIYAEKQMFNLVNIKLIDSDGLENNPAHMATELGPIDSSVLSIETNKAKNCQLVYILQQKKMAVSLKMPDNSIIILPKNTKKS